MGRSPRCGGLPLSLISSVFHIDAWVGWVRSKYGLIAVPVAPLHADIRSHPTEEL